MSCFMDGGLGFAFATVMDRRTTGKLKLAVNRTLGKS